VHNTTVELHNADGVKADPIQNFFVERYLAAYANELNTFIDAVDSGNRDPRPNGFDGCRRRSWRKPQPCHARPASRSRSPEPIRRTLSNTPDRRPRKRPSFAVNASTFAVNFHVFSRGLACAAGGRPRPLSRTIFRTPIPFRPCYGTRHSKPEAILDDVKDSNGNILKDGDSVHVIKDLKVKGAGETLKRGTLIKNIRLTGNPAEIEGRTGTIKGLVLKTEFVKKA
jgi:protein PhnA